jgi:hypothetical protein
MDAPEDGHKWLKQDENYGICLMKILVALEVYHIKMPQYIHISYDSVVSVVPSSILF